MIPGPLIGGWLGSRFGTPVVVDGVAGVAPSALIFQVSAAITILAIIPLILIRRKFGKKTEIKAQV